MTQPFNSQTKIGFETIVRLLSDHCLSPIGKEHADKIHFLSDFSKLQPLLQQTSEFRNIILSEKPFPQQDYIDCRVELLRLKTKGSIISIEGLKDLQIFYHTITEITRYILSLPSEKYPHIKKLIEEVEIFNEIPQRIFSILDQSGEIRDRASEKLYNIRREIRARQASSQRRISKYLAEAKKAGYTTDDAEITVRSGRLVIPVITSYKRNIGGFVHDVSTTGQTVFVEPEEIFALNNEIAQLQNDEQIEIINILRSFSEFLYPYVPSCLQGAHFMGVIDFIFAKAKLAIDMHAGLPIIFDHPHILWREARHPLLEMVKPVVPLNISLEKDERIVIISGPNAGGKSVVLKTVALLQTMLQCGLLPPMREDSEIGIFEEIFVDIGDEQSIENDLSTYSSHLKNMRILLENGSPKTLFLIDELGSGTEPQAGGAIAEALLENLSSKKMYGVVTTHYANLKLLAKRHESIINGAMLYDKKALKPTYIFQKGLPGSSFAFEIADKMGLPKNMLASARKKTGRSHLNFEEELQQLEVEKEEVRKELKGMQITDRLLEETLTKYNALYEDLYSKKSKIIRDAKDEAQTIISNANAQIEKTIREIKETNAEKEKVKQARKTLSLYSDKLLIENDPHETKPTTKPTTKPKAMPEAKPATMEDIFKGLEKAGWKVKINKNCRMESKNK
ncbi:MAG: endonuclease MutS2 [Bacteroidales bacterium]|nr:endonuclease MutS2 [Bacteroidales bacterium]